MVSLYTFGYKTPRYGWQSPVIQCPRMNASWLLCAGETFPEKNGGNRTKIARRIRLRKAMRSLDSVGCMRQGHIMAPRRMCIGFMMRGFPFRQNIVRSLALVTMGEVTQSYSVTWINILWGNLEMSSVREKEKYTCISKAETTGSAKVLCLPSYFALDQSSVGSSSVTKKLEVNASWRIWDLRDGSVFKGELEDCKFIRSTSHKSTAKHFSGRCYFH